MAYNYEYPYGDTQMFNIDWVLAKIAELEQAINVDAYKYIGENIYNDWNQAQPQTITYIPIGSLALNQAMEGASGLLFTNGNSENLEQRFYAFSSGDRWYRSARNGVWLMWTNKDDDSSYLKGLPQSSTYNANNAEPNTYLYAYGNPANFPSGVSAGMIVNYQTNDSGLLQIIYPTVGSDTWKRIKTSDGVFGQWMNVNDYSSFLNYVDNIVIDINTLSINTIYSVQSISPNLPDSSTSLVITTGKSNFYYQIVFSTSSNLYMRRNINSTWEDWINLNQNNLKQYFTAFDNANNAPLNTFIEISAGYTQNMPTTSGYYTLITLSASITDIVQFAIELSNGKMYYRYKPGSSAWSNWNSSINTTALLSTQHTDIYSTALANNYNLMSTEESTKGSSFMHADEGYKSFSDAIMESDLSDKDMIVTNLEMWDMDTPINELTAKVSEVVTHIKETSPLTGFTLYSLPPIDVPFFGNELYTYEWPSGNTLTEVDEALLALAQEMGFKYITWREYDHINDNNLLSLYDDLFNNDLYKHSLESYIESTI